MIFEADEQKVFARFNILKVKMSKFGLIVIISSIVLIGLKFKKLMVWKLRINLKLQIL